MTKFENYLDVHYDNSTYIQLCAKLKKHELTKQAESDANGLKFEAHIAQEKQQEESAAEHVHYADSRSILKNKYHPRWEEQRQNPQNSKHYSRRSYSRSPSRESHRKRGHSPSPYSYSRDRDQNSQYNSGGDSPNSGRDRRPGTDKRVFRVSDSNKEWRSNGTGYGGQRSSSPHNRRSPSPHGRSSHYGRQQQDDGGVSSQQPSGSQCFKCKGWGHRKAECPSK